VELDIFFGRHGLELLDDGLRKDPQVQVLELDHVLVRLGLFHVQDMAYELFTVAGGLFDAAQRLLLFNGEIVLVRL